MPPSKEELEVVGAECLNATLHDVDHVVEVDEGAACAVVETSKKVEWNGGAELDEVEAIGALVVEEHRGEASAFALRGFLG